MTTSFAICGKIAHTIRGVSRYRVSIVLCSLVLADSQAADAWMGQPLCSLEPPPDLSLSAPTHAPMCMPVVRDPSSMRNLAESAAKQAWRQALALTETDPEQALLELEIVHEAMPRLRDMVTLHKGILFSQTPASFRCTQCFCSGIRRKRRF